MALVRIKPINKKRGNTIRRYTIFHHTFHVDDGWSEVNDQAAEILAQKTIDPHDPQSALVFDVVYSLEEANRLERIDRKMEMVRTRRTEYRGPRRAKVVNPGVGQTRLVEEKKSTSAETTKVAVRHVGSVSDQEEFADDEFDELDTDVDPMTVEDDIEELTGNEDPEGPEGMDPTDEQPPEPATEPLKQRPRSPATKSAKKSTKKSTSKKSTKKKGGDDVK